MVYISTALPCTTFPRLNPNLTHISTLNLPIPPPRARSATPHENNGLGPPPHAPDGISCPPHTPFSLLCQSAARHALLGCARLTFTTSPARHPPPDHVFKAVGTHGRLTLTEDLVGGPRQVLGRDGVPYPALSRPSGTSSFEKCVSSPTAPPPQIASLVTTAVMEVATGARRMSGQDRLAMGPG